MTAPLPMVFVADSIAVPVSAANLNAIVATVNAGIADAASEVATARANEQVTNVFSYSGALIVAPGKSRIFNDTGRTLTIIATRASVNTAPTGATILVDIMKNGTTIFTTQANRPTIAISEFTAAGGTPAIASWAGGEYLTVDIAQVGSAVAGSDLTVQVTAR